MGDVGVSGARAAWALGAAAWLAACAPSGADASEVAAELRALRLALANQGAVSDPERAALSAAVAAVGKTQHELAERQAALQAELKGWAQLVAHDAGAQRSAEAKALAARVAELDAELQQQKVRQAELEAVLRQTLDRAADRIDALLQRRDGAAVSPAAGGPAGSAAKSDVTPVGGFAFDVRLLWAAVAAAGVVTASYVLRGKPVALAATAGAADGAEDGVPPEAIAPFTALAEAGPAVVAAAAGPAPPASEVLVVAPAQAAATLAALVAEPLVLRRPAPLAVAGAAGVEVRYWLAPACTPAARLRLRQRVLASR